MTISSIDTLFYTLLFIIPGFIIDYIYRYCFPQETQQSKILRYLWFSILYLFISSPILILLASNDFYSNNQTWSVIILVILLFVGPVLIGILIAWLSNKEIFRKGLQKIGISPLHIIPSAWDYRFSKLTEPSYMIVYLADGSEILGFYGNNSFSSSNKENRDIYLEKIYVLDDSNIWSEVPNNKGLWIAGEQIKYIEFR